MYDIKSILKMSLSLLDFMLLRILKDQWLLLFKLTDANAIISNFMYLSVVLQSYFKVFDKKLTWLYCCQSENVYKERCALMTTVTCSYEV